MKKKIPVTVVCVVCLLAWLSAGACLSQKKVRNFSDSSQKLLLNAHQSGERLPFTISLTIRLKAGVLSEQKPDKIVLLWIERRPDGRYRRAQEEFTIDAAEFDEDLYFYRNYDVDMVGAYTYNVTLFPNDPSLRLHSNKKSIRVQQSVITGP